MVEQLYTEAGGILRCIGNSGLWVEGSDLPPLLSPGGATSGVPRAVLGSPVQEGQRATGGSPAKGHKDGQGIGASV